MKTFFLLPLLVAVLLMSCKKEALLTDEAATKSYSSIVEDRNQGTVHSAALSKCAQHWHCYQTWNWECGCYNPLQCGWVECCSKGAIGEYIFGQQASVDTMVPGVLIEFWLGGTSMRFDTLTDENGHYAIDADALPDGEYMVTANKSEWVGDTMYLRWPADSATLDSTTFILRKYDE